MAGNGIYTMKGKYTQAQLDEYVYQLLSAVINSENLKNKIISIRSGGQTGIDEAGAKAGMRLGIPTTILAPKGWTFRPINGKDKSSESYSIENSLNIILAKVLPSGQLLPDSLKRLKPKPAPKKRTQLPEKIDCNNASCGVSDIFIFQYFL